MLTFGHAAIVAAYVVVALALLLLSLFSRWPWQVKTGLVVVTSAAYCACYFALPALLGWPTDRDVPKRFNLIGVYIQEPDKRTGEPGNVFFWAADLDPDRDQRPRAYRLPFSLKTKAVFQEGQGKLRQNIPQVGEVEEDDEVHGVPQDRGQLGQKSVKIELKDAPPAGPPSKDAGG